MRRVFKYTNAFLGLALLALGAGFYWFVWRTLPDYGGSARLDVTAAASIARDQHGVPHIRAARIEDAVYLQGYVHAQDRFWQMEATRRMGAGELAEIVGAAALERDLDYRRLRLRPTAERMAQTLPEADRKWFAAYARGVNDWLSQNQERLPLEIRMLGFTPRAWSITDSLLLGLVMYRQLSSTWTTEADRARLLSQGDPEKVKQLFPLRTGTEIAVGSNAWAVGPARTKTGKALLAGDPHLEVSWPSTFYLNHLQAEDLDCIGGSLPGAPGIIIGHNQRIAWSMTNLHFDVQDLYWNETRVIAQTKETIRVKGQPDVEVNLPLTPHGPLVERNGKFYALRWPPFDGQYALPFLDLNRARNWQEFRQALSRFPGPSHNFVYADVDGNIGYQAAGKMPIRKTTASQLPLDATNPDHEWLGYIPFDELPSRLNPPLGMVVSANQNPFPEDYRYPVAGHFTPPYRQRQIAARLEAQAKWSAREMSSIQTDVYSAFHHYLAQEIAKAAKRRQAARDDFAEAREILAQWNGQMEVGMAAPLIAVLAYERVWDSVLKSAGGPIDLPQGLFPPAVVEKLLRERPKSWFADYDQMLVSALLGALDEGAKRFGKNPRLWDYGRYSQIYLANPVLSQAVNVGRFLARPGLPLRSWIETLRLPLVDSYVQAGPHPLSGGSQTVKQVNSRLGAAFRFLADTADWENSYFTLTLGQSGHAFTKHSRDYWEAYYNAGQVPLLYKKFDTEAELKVEPRAGGR